MSVGALDSEARTGHRLVEHDLDSFLGLADQWNRLALFGESPYLSAAWLGAWWRAFGEGDGCVALALHDEDGALLAGAVFARERAGRLRAAVDSEAAEWDVVAVDERARQGFWECVAADDHGVLELARLPRDTVATATTQAALAEAGYTVSATPDLRSPTLELPGSFEELLATRKSKMRNTMRRRRSALEREGTLELRATTAPGEALERDLEAFLALEASGWKADAGTAIRSRPATERLYRDFAVSAAAEGWLRLHLLELDGRPIAGGYDCAFAGAANGMKLAVDDRLRELSPGTVLVAATLEASISEGLTRFNFLGGPDPHKLQWTDELREHVTLRAFRGPRTLPERLWWQRVRPTLKRGRDAVRAVRRR